MRYWATRTQRLGWRREQAGGLFWHGKASVATLVSGKVSSWTDLTLNARHATQGTDASRWTHSASDANFNGQASISAAGGQDMQTSAWTTIPQPIVYTAVCKFGSVASKCLFDNVTGHNLLQAPATTIVQMYDGVKIFDSTVASNKMLNANIVTAIFNGAASQLYLNGALIATGDGGTNGSQGLALGVFSGVGNRYIGSLAEFMIQDKIADLPKIWRALSFDYGIALE